MITQTQYQALVNLVFQALMKCLDMADLGEAKDEAESIVRLWVEAQGIEIK